MERKIIVQALKRSFSTQSAQLLAGWAAERLGTLTRFSFRASAALFVQEDATLGTDGERFWVAGPDGRLCMMAEAA